MKKVLNVVLVLILCLLSATIAIQMSDNKDYAESKYVDTNLVAVVNLDEGIINPDNTVTNYGKFFLQEFDGVLESVSGTQAISGMNNGKYAGVITIPKDFSKGIYSINDINFLKSTIKYEISDKIDSKNTVVVNETINNFFNYISKDTSFLFVNAMLKEVNYAQSQTSEILKNNEAISSSVSDNNLDLEKVEIPSNNIELKKENDPTLEKNDLIAPTLNQEEIKSSIEAISDNLVVSYKTMHDNFSEFVNVSKDKKNDEKIKKDCYKDIKAEELLMPTGSTIEEYLNKIGDIMNNSDSTSCQKYQLIDEDKKFDIPVVSNFDDDEVKKNIISKMSELEISIGKKIDGFDSQNENYKKDLEKLIDNNINIVKKHSETEKINVNEYVDLQEEFSDNMNESLTKNYSDNIEKLNKYKSDVSNNIAQNVKENTEIVSKLVNIIPNSKKNGGINKSYVEFSIMPFTFDNVSNNNNIITKVEKEEKTDLKVIIIILIIFILLISSVLIYLKLKEKNE